MSEKSKKSKRILLSAGGTGGHVYPAIALGHDLLSRGYQVEIVTDKRGEAFKDDMKSIHYHVIKAGTLGAGLSGKVKGLSSLGVGIMQAFSLIKSFQPSVVVGFGGYPSFPAVYAAQKKGIPTVLHEQNAVLGKANLMLAPKADRIALSMDRTSDLQEADAVRAVVTGNPVRPDIAALYTKPYPMPETDGPLNIFVMGGSLGASVFSDILPEALSKLSDNYKSRLRITQQCRKEDLERTEKAYAEANINARLATFFNDIPEILEKCQLFIGRAGASTVAEMTAAGRPSIFVPYPHHNDDQQKMNAEHIVEAGGAWIMDQNGFNEQALLPRIETFLQNPERLFNAAEAARDCGRPDAARRLGNLVTALASGWNKQKAEVYDLSQGRE